MSKRRYRAIRTRASEREARQDAARCPAELAGLTAAQLIALIPSTPCGHRRALIARCIAALVAKRDALRVLDAMAPAGLRLPDLGRHLSQIVLGEGDVI